MRALRNSDYEKTSCGYALANTRGIAHAPGAGPLKLLHPMLVTVS